MSQEDQDAVIGRVIREKVAAEKLVASLQSEARRIGEMYIDIGTLLRDSPAYLVFSGVSTDAKYSRSNSTFYEARSINGDELVKLTSSLRDALIRLERLKAEAAKFGA